MRKLCIEKNNLKDWLERILVSGCRTYAPVTKEGITDYSEIHSPEEVDYEAQTTRLSMKALAFPQTEVLFRYEREGKDVCLKEPEKADNTPIVVWGCRPCDAHAFQPLSGIFNWDVSDTQYNRRRERMTLVSFSCLHADAFCFCTSVGGGPGATEGSDILVTVMGQKALIEVLTERGEQLMRLCREAKDAEAEDLQKETVLAQVDSAFCLAEVQKQLSTSFEKNLWKRQSERCLGCGVCAYVCPTCACFDIQEASHGCRGARVRCWDSCGFALFTRHTSGYNPRPTQASRWRQRVYHKFSYMPQRLQQLGCVGCGRCSRACPVDMNMKEHLIQIEHSDHE